MDISQNEIADKIELLKSSFLLQGIVRDQLFETLADFSDFHNYGVYDLVWDYAGKDHKIPFSIIERGCIAVVDKRSEDGDENIIDALLMSKQLFGEFQLLDASLPKNIELLAFSKTRVLSLNPEFEDLMTSAEKVIFYKNLAFSIFQKIKLSNVQLRLRSMTGVPWKLAEYLNLLYRKEIWRSILRRNKNNKFNVDIYWKILSFSQFLACDDRRLALALIAFQEMNVGNIEWFDRDLKIIPDVQSDEIYNIRNIDKRLNKTSFFKLKNIDRSRLRELPEVKLNDIESRFKKVPNKKKDNRSGKNTI